MGTAVALLSWAAKEVGTVESPPGSNKIRYWDDIGMHGYNAVVVGGKVVKQGQPWCCAFVLAGLERIGVGPVTTSAYVPQVRNDYQRAGRLYGIEQALPGDQVMFSFGDHAARTHTGIVESVDLKAHTVTSIDGNTSSALGGSEVNGGGVYRRTRPWSQTWGVGRPAFDPPTGVKPMYDPPLTDIVASRPAPKGTWLLKKDGAIFAIDGAPYAGGANGKPYFAGRTAADFADLNDREVAAGKLYVILSEQPGGRYAYPE